MHSLLRNRRTVFKARAAGRKVKTVRECHATLSGRSRAGKRALPLPFLIFLCAGALVMFGRLASATTATPEGSAMAPSIQSPDYSTFSHSSPREHSDLIARTNCGSCHRRSNSSLAPRFPLHRDCTNCHLVQFTAANSTSVVNPICTICHTKDNLSSSNPPTRRFSRLRSFNAEFDHAQHLQGKESARPKEGCTGCHSPARRGVAESIPARLEAHQICYECHSPGKEANDSSSCGFCHRLSSYSATSTVSRGYGFGFNHAEHGARARLTCQNCHNIKGRGLRQSRQVTSILPVEHLVNGGAQNCKTCHDGQRSFGDNDFNVCSRCHKRTGFRS